MLLRLILPLALVVALTVGAMFALAPAHPSSGPPDAAAPAYPACPKDIAVVRAPCVAPVAWFQHGDFERR